jgi:DNA-binding LytR/AlgR family response regulator
MFRCDFLSKTSCREFGCPHPNHFADQPAVWLISRYRGEETAMNIKLGIRSKFLALSLMMFIGFCALTGFAAQQIHQTIIDEHLEKIRSLNEIHNLSEGALPAAKAAYGDDIDTHFAEVARQFFALAMVIGLAMAGCGYLMLRRITREIDSAAQKVGHTIADLSDPQSLGRSDQPQHTELYRRQEADARTDYVKTFTVRADKRLIFVGSSDIEWIEANKDYAVLHVGAKKHLIREKLHRLEQQLDPARFIRIHRSTIVKIDQIVEMHLLSNQDARVQLLDGTPLRVSRTYIDQLVSRLEQIRGYVIPRQAGGPRPGRNNRSNIA